MGGFGFGCQVWVAGDSVSHQYTLATLVIFTLLGFIAGVFLTLKVVKGK